jgi:prepilin-type N-terminal cleavage/methylation domain-containing protein
MNAVDLKTDPRKRIRAFTLVEMLVVIAIMSILMTAGAIGLGGMGGKGVSSGVATAESLFDEARSMAVGKNVRTCVLIAKDLTNNGADNLRRMVVAYENIDSTTGVAKDPDSATPDWVLSSRGAVLPEQTYFSQTFSVKDHNAGTGTIETVPGSQIKSAPSAGSGPAAAAKSTFAGEYFIYEFNAEGICTTPGASFVIGSGTRGLTASALKSAPRITKAGKRDFGGFVVWRNGRTSVFRSPAQISSRIANLNTGAEF